MLALYIEEYDLTPDEAYMRRALIQAEKAALLGEVPVGAVLVINGEIIAEDHNRRETAHDSTAHAEMLVLRTASERLGRWRLSDADIFVTLEPCPMCAGALVLARISRLVYGAVDSKAGAIESLYRIAEDNRLNHRLKVVKGVLEKECSSFLRDFFKSRRSMEVL